MSKGAGKGPRCRKGFDPKKYRESSYWKNLEREKRDIAERSEGNEGIRSGNTIEKVSNG